MEGVKRRTLQLQPVQIYWLVMNAEFFLTHISPSKGLKLDRTSVAAIPNYNRINQADSAKSSDRSTPWESDATEQ